MLYREIIAVCSEIHAKHINVLWAEHRIYECNSWCYIKWALGFKRLNSIQATDQQWEFGAYAA